MPTATTAWPALGTTIAYSPDGTSFIPLGQVLTISNAGGGTVGQRDTTTLSSPVRTSAPTIPDNGEVSFEVNFDPTDEGHIQVRTWKDSPSGTMPQWKVSWPTGTGHSETFSGYVVTFDGGNASGVDANITATVTVRVSGAVTHA